MRRVNHHCGLMTLSTILAFAVIAHAVPYTPGNLLIYRVGNGAAALGTTATAVTIDEYDSVSGTIVQSFPLATTGTSALTAVGNSTTEGIMSLSQDGTMAVFTGYRKDAGGTSPSGDAPATTNRVIGTLTLATGTTNASIALTNPTSNIRSATTVNGSSYYIGIAGTIGVGYVASPGPAATAVQIDARNSRQVLLANDTLFATNGSTAITGKLQTYGAVGTPPTALTSASAIVNRATTDAGNGFFLADLSPTVGIGGVGSNVDTAYLLSTVENLLLKYTFDGTIWNLTGSVTANGTQDIGGRLNALGGLDLFLTSTSSVRKLVDASGYNGTLTALSASFITAPTNTGFRGIIATAAVAIPEPSAYLFGALATMLAGGATFGRRMFARS